MNPFLALLVLMALAAWVIGALILTVGPILYLWRERFTDPFEGMLAALTLSGGLAMFLVLGAVLTGGIQFADRPDGCYYVHRQLVGKTFVTEYDPIKCVGVDVP